jgi:hypothetical protein
MLARWASHKFVSKQVGKGSLNSTGYKVFRERAADAGHNRV